MSEIVRGRVEDHLQRLRLHSVAARLDAVLSEAARKEPTYLDFLDGPTAYTLALSSLDAEGRESRLSSDLLYSPPSYLLHLPVVYR